MSKNKFEVIITETDEGIKIKLVDYESLSKVELFMEEIAVSTMAVITKLVFNKFKESYNSCYNKSGKTKL